GRRSGDGQVGDDAQLDAIMAGQQRFEPLSRAFFDVALEVGIASHVAVDAEARGHDVLCDVENSHPCAESAREGACVIERGAGRLAEVRRDENAIELDHDTPPCTYSCSTRT